LKLAYFAGSLSENIDGVSRVLYRIAKFNRNQQLDSIFISPDTDPAIGSETMKLRGVAVPGYSEYKLSLSLPNRIIKALTITNFIPDLVHLHSPCTTGLAGLKVARSFNVPVVATYHTHFPAYLKYHRASRLETPVKKYLRWFYKQCDIVFVPSRFIQDELEQTGLHRSVLLPHGVDEELFCPAKFSSELKNRFGGKKILLYAGRLVWEKNLQILVTAIRKLEEEREDFVLWIAGKGNAENELRKELPEAVFFGFCDNEKLAMLYATADVLVFPSDTETFGNVILEAMSSGTCCIVANKGGANDLVTDNQNGYTFVSSNPDGLASKINHLLSHPKLLNDLSASALQYSSQYKWIEILKKQASIYGELVNDKR
jgi:phosphatidylinositol alpha 1,6-mannosyltransferase